MSGLETYMRSRAWRHLSLTAFDPAPALRVLDGLDLHDRQEVHMGFGIDLTPGQLLRGLLSQELTGGHLAIAWHHAPEGGAAPFAIVGVARGAAAGSGVASLIARDHLQWHPAIRRLVIALRDDLPGWMLSNGFRRIEARCWTKHPTAAELLRGMGFVFETEIHGFGVTSSPWAQFALVPERGH
jgi:hypothetical protein